MNDDQQGWLPPGQAYRLKRAFWLMLLINLCLTLSLVLSLYTVKEKDQQIDDMLDQTRSLVDDTQSLIDQTRTLVTKARSAE